MSEDELLKTLEANFGRVKIKGNYAYICSPFNPNDRHPSCSVLLKDTDKFTEGFFKDFSTGRSGNIYTLLGIPHDFKKQKKIKLPQLESPSEVKFHISTFRYEPSSYLFARGIPYDVQEKFKVHEYPDRVSMPVFDKDGYFAYDVSRLTQTKGYANSAPTESIPAFTHEIKDTDIVFICESMIDAMTFYAVGWKAIALNGAGNHAGLPKLFKKHFGKIVLALDPDDAGRLHASEIMQSLNGKDVTDMVLDYDVNECWTLMLSAMPFEEAVKKFRSYVSRKANLDVE